MPNPCLAASKIDILLSHLRFISHLQLRSTKSNVISTKALHHPLFDSTHRRAASCHTALPAHIARGTHPKQCCCTGFLPQSKLCCRGDSLRHSWRKFQHCGMCKPHLLLHFHCCNCMCLQGKLCCRGDSLRHSWRKWQHCGMCKPHLLLHFHCCNCMQKTEGQKVSVWYKTRGFAFHLHRLV